MMPAGAHGTPPGLRLVRDDEPERIVLAHEPPFRIGEAEFRPATREVIFDGATSIVEPRVMQLLVALHRADGAVVSKDDLTELCWEGRVVGEDAINRVVSRARAVSEKQAGRQFRLETITKVGYRLVNGNGAAQAPQAPVPDPANESDKGIQRRDILVGGIALGAVAAAGAGWTILHHDPTPPEAQLLIANARSSIREGTVDEVDNAIAKLRLAVEIAPNSAEAWGMLAFAYMASAKSAPSPDRPALAARGNAAIQRALSLEPYQPDALTAQILSTRQYRNWYNYEMALRSALARNPDHPVLNCLMAFQLVQVGRDAEAVGYSQKGVKDFPLSANLHVCETVTLWDLGRLDEAEAALDRAFALMPRYYGLWFTKLYFLMYNGRAGEAAAMIADKNSRPLGIPDWNYDLTAAQVNALASGDAASVRHTIDLWKTAPDRGTGFTENAAIFAGFAGDNDEAFRLLNALYFNRGSKMADTYFAKEQGIYSGVERHTFTLFRRPILGIHRDPRFGAMTGELGLDEYWRRTNSRSLVIA
jgi:DNA-binding winged helix-turn-helix (wHTH) protein/tetratricopeptide (TPR) repeat protein